MTEKMETPFRIEVLKVTSEHLDPSTEFVTQGTIYRSDSDEVVCHGLPVCKQLNSWDELEDVLEKNPDMGIRLYQEGSLLRFFYDNDKWHVSTSRKMDAFKTSWGNRKSFGKLFEDALFSLYKETLASFLTKLNVEYVYYFLFTSKDIFYVNPVEEDRIQLLFVLNKQNELVISEASNFQTVEYLDKEEVKNLYDTDGLMGVILENEFKRYCLFTRTYSERKDVFGNKKYFAIRLLEATDEEKEKLIKLYPESEEYLKLIQKEKIYFCKNAHRTYIRRHVQKNWEETEPNIHHFVKEIKKEYLKERKPMYIEDVIQLFNNQSSDSKFIYLRKYIPIQIGGNLQ